MTVIANSIVDFNTYVYFSTKKKSQISSTKHAGKFAYSKLKFIENMSIDNYLFVSERYAHLTLYAKQYLSLYLQKPHAAKLTKKVVNVNDFCLCL